MKRMISMIMIMALATMPTACGGGGGGGGESQGNETESSSFAVTPAAAVIAGPDTALYTISLLAIASSSYAVALNDSGQVIGHYLDAQNQINAFKWQDKTVKTVVTGGEVRRINSHGQIVGWQELGQSEAFLYEADGEMIQLNTLGGASQAMAINDAGQTAGRITRSGDKAYVDQSGVMQLIANEVDGYAIAMNNLGDVLILAVNGNGCRTLLWRHGVLTDLGDFGGELTVGRDMNDAGQVVGWAQTTSGDYHPFLWDDGVLHDLSVYTGSFGAAVAINEAGVILLKASDVTGGRNLLLDHGVVTDLANFGSNYAVVNDLNSRGQIVGWMADAAGVMHAFLATPKS